MPLATVERSAVRYRLRVGDLILDKSSVVPLYLQLKQHLIHLISYGTWQPNMPVPSVRQLATDLQMATATVQRVYQELQAEGFLVAQPGRGVFVADTASSPPPPTAERSEILRALLARPISHARSLGFADAELLEAVGRITSTAAPSAGQARVVFVGSSELSKQKYPPILRQAMGRLGVTVEGVAFSELEANVSLLDAFEPIVMMVALVGTYPYLREIAARRKIQLYGLVVDLAESTQRRLIHLPPDGDVALIGQPQYVSGARALLRQYFVGDDRVHWATPTNLAAVQELVHRCPIVIYTLGAAEIVRAHVPASAQTIELEYQPNPASLARLVRQLAAELPGHALTTAEPADATVAG
jgi:GntR family transcriptional regulator